MPTEDFVSRQWLIDEYHRRHRGPPGGALKMIEEAPSVDAEPKRKTGYWLPHYDDEGYRLGYICSECGVWYVFDDLNGAHYCMNCGSPMLPEPPKGEENA